MTAGWEGLVAAIISDTPHLPGALCRQQSALFDGDDDEHARQAAGICHRCPERAPCAAWADKLACHQINGVLGGQHYVWVSHSSLIRNRNERKSP